MTDVDRVAAAGQLALAEAERLWGLNIFEPAPDDHTERGEFCRKAIEDLIRAVGWDWALPYLGHDRAASGQLEWCGIFAGACWVRAGLDPAIARVWVESTYRLDAFARYEPIEGHPNPMPSQGEPLRHITDLDARSTELPWDPQPGDILTIGPSGYGQHICVVDHFDREHRMFYTVEGNGVGLGPDGKKRWGVVRGMRPLGGSSWHARRLIRLAASDLVAAG